MKVADVCSEEKKELTSFRLSDQHPCFRLLQPSFFPSNLPGKILNLHHIAYIGATSVCVPGLILWDCVPADGDHRYRSQKVADF